MKEINIEQLGAVLGQAITIRGSGSPTCAPERQKNMVTLLRAELDVSANGESVETDLYCFVVQSNTDYSDECNLGGFRSYTIHQFADEAQAVKFYENHIASGAQEQ